VGVTEQFQWIQVFSAVHKVYIMKSLELIYFLRNNLNAVEVSMYLYYRRYPSMWKNTPPISSNILAA